MIERSGWCTMAASAAFLLVGCGGVADAPAPEQVAAVAMDGPADPSGRAFFDELSARCGQLYTGRTILAPEFDDVFEPARLYIRFQECGPDEIRVGFKVGADTSRTWILRMEEGRLGFFHEHLAEDGTEYEASGFGGWVDGQGYARYQSFPDHQAAPGTPPDELRIWRLRIAPEIDQLIYNRDAGATPWYILVFHLGPPSPQATTPGWQGP